jgi:hypothetical protein
MQERLEWGDMPSDVSLRAWRSASWGLAVILLASCDPPTDPEPDYSFGGPCIPDAPSSGLVGDAELSLEIAPSPVEYDVQFDRELTIRNLGVAEIRVEPQAEYCVEQVWLRGADPMHDRVCTSNSFYLAAGSETLHIHPGQFRPTGPQFATPTEPGLRADPGIYCASVIFRLAGDSIVLETAFELLGP